MTPCALTSVKYTGDGLSAYFAAPSFIIKSDAATDCAYCVRRLIYDAVNGELEARGLPAIDVRLGLDGGEAAIQILGSPRTKRHADLIGDVVSLACKIESRAGTGEIYLGKTVERNLHFRWRELCAPVALAADWTYSISGGDPYPCFGSTRQVYGLSSVRESLPIRSRLGSWAAADEGS